MTALGLPTVLFGGSYLGSISHTLTALETAQARGLSIAGLVISQSRDPQAPAFVEALSEVAALAGNTMVVGAPPNDPRHWPGRLLDTL
jgi:dethiobiotin synthetase